MPIIEQKYPQVYFRVDHGQGIGDGHLFRDKALASKMKEMGFAPVFVTRPREGFNQSKFHPFSVITLKENTNKLNESSTYKDWLSVSEEVDAHECLSLVKNTPPAIWVVDHYGIEAAWEKAMLDGEQFVLTIDDLFRSHHSHMILDHNLSAERAKYRNTFTGSLYLMGPLYALLRDDVCKAPEYLFDEEKKSYLLFLGAAEEALFYKILEPLRLLNLEKLVILNPPAGFQARPSEEILSFCNNVPELYKTQKVVIGSCGVAHLERMALGVPSLTCVIVENQKDVGRKTEELEISWHLGDLRTINHDNLLQQLKIGLNSPELLKERVVRGKNIIAKNGAEKVVREIIAQITKWQSR